MFTATKKILFFTALLTGGTLFAQSADYSLYLTAITNSNVSSQQDVSHVISFMASGGTDSLDMFDQGNETSIPTSLPFAFPFTHSSHNDNITQNDSRPLIDHYQTIDCGFYTNSPATITFTATYIVMSLTSTSAGDSTSPPLSLSGPGYFLLERISTGEIFNVLGDTVTLNLPVDTDFTCDFRLHFGPMIYPAPFVESCPGSGDGKIEVTNLNNTNWDLKLYRNNGLLLASHITTQDTIFTGLSTGAYSVVTRINNIRVDSSVVYVNSPPAIVPAFTATSYAPLAGSSVDFTNTSSYASGYLWDFGDSTTDTTMNASHTYASPGAYTVTLTAMNGSCQQSTTAVINVQAPIMNYNQSQSHYNYANPTVRQGAASLATGPKKIMVNQPSAGVLNVQVLDLAGRRVTSLQSDSQTIDIAVPQPGIYLVLMQAADGAIRTEKVFVAE